MFRSVYDWTLAKCAHPLAERWLALISFVESSIFPIPPDVLLGPMCLARPERSFRYAAICTVASVVGALLGYAIGLFLFETVGQWVFAMYGLEDKYAAFAENFNEHGWIVVFLAGFTPLPFKVITIAAGATAMPLHVLLLASLIARSARFFLVAFLFWKFGFPIKAIIDRHFNAISIVIGIIFVGGFAAVSYLV